MTNEENVSPEQAAQQLWEAGILRWKLHSGQTSLYDQFYQNNDRRFVITSSRQFGKSYLLCLLAIEHALRIPDCQIKYAAPTAKMVRGIITPLFRQILKECPDHIRPQWFSQESRYDFPNGSVINVAGADGGNAESLRGTRAHLCVVDEAGFVADLDYLVKDILSPMCLTTRGRMLIASTPAKTPRHPFELYFKEAELSGAAVRKTIYDNPLLTPKDIADAMKDAGGENTSTWRREYLAKFEIDEEAVVIPEFTEEAERFIVREIERPPYFDAYVALDVGVIDATVALFGYWDFKRAELVIEDELVLHGIKQVRTDIIADGVKETEQRLWDKQKPYFRISDTDLILINDLDNLHNLKFVTADKDRKENGVNELRLMIQTKKLVIHPRCRTLIAHLKNAIWDANREKFARVKGFYHFDALDSLIYLIRGLRRNHNPYPVDQIIDYNTHYNRKKGGSSITAFTLKNIFSPNFKN